ncbi:MAG: NifU family protein [Planctomycetota bacterium]
MRTDSTSSQTNTDSGAVAIRVAQVIERIRPAVQSDGGDLELVEVSDTGVVRVRLHGACVGCPSASMTLKVGIERNLREHVPEVTAVEAIE